MVRLGDAVKDLCEALLHVDTEEGVIELLEETGYWSDPKAWRPYGDREDNFSTIGNQSSAADAALVEKIVNSVDAVLMGECWSNGLPPNSPGAPRSIPEAVAEFFHGDRRRSDTLGHISHWDNSKRREISNRITLAATGDRRVPSFTIVDSGEGQTPDRLADTILSIDKQNKIDVHFVQGKFNMGGTGALRFCGRNNLQLIISRRNPGITDDPNAGESSGQWSFTVVRRENPTNQRRVSTYTYLAPVHAEFDPGRGTVLRFDAPSLPLFPSGNEAYARDAAWGTAIKLYEYQSKRFRSHILRRDGLLQRLDVLLPKIALPVRLHECRDYSGGPGSFDTTLNGVVVRLADDRSQNLEEGFPTSSALSINGERMTAELYAFRRGRGDTYRKSEGVVFTVNGQTHGSLSRAFFSRKAVGMNRLEDSILLIVDCSKVSGRTREDLFMNSRDRMEQGEFLSSLETELESILREHQLLKDLRQRRRQEDVAAKLEDSKSFQAILETILRKSPSLASLFQMSGPLSDPFRSTKTKGGTEFQGKQHPTFFRFKDLDYGAVLYRNTPVNMRSRISFETDVESDYLTRAHFPGNYEIIRTGINATNSALPDSTLNFDNGIATLNLRLPEEATAGDRFEYEIKIVDETLVEPFVNRFEVSVISMQKTSGGSGKRSTNRMAGSNNGSGPEGLAMPTPVLVYEPEWGNHRFDRYSALKAVFDPSDDESQTGSYTYYLNMDNVYLQTELKQTRENPGVVKSKWQFGLVLIGMALLRAADESESNGTESSNDPVEDDQETSVEDQVSRATAAIAPVLLPLIEHLGALTENELVGVG